MPDTIHKLLNTWFGSTGSADLPNSDRMNLWFGDNETIKKELAFSFIKEFEEAKAGALKDWANTPRGRLALIILFDQFSRHIHNKSKLAFENDANAQTLCLEGIENKIDKSLTFIERVFFYMPLVHSEDIHHQEKSIRLYQELVSSSMRETTQIYQLFLAYAYAHFRVIKELGRFPQRNKILERESTSTEMSFLKNT